MSRFPLANKNFGQHFLSSQHVISKITQLLPEGTDAIVEIGPGPAVLTPHLAKHQRPLFVIEMDERFLEHLNPIVGPDHVYMEDALEFNWKDFLVKRNLSKIWLVSNLPYNISVPLTLSFLRIPQIKNMTLMYQKEVADKILPRELKNSMNSLHAMIQTQFDVSFVVNAPPGAFVPPPKVDSSVLQFSRKTTPLISLNSIDHYEKFLRLVFGQKRKQLGGILKKEWGAENVIQIFNKAELSLQIRAETLTMKQILNLYEISLSSLS